MPLFCLISVFGLCFPQTITHHNRISAGGCLWLTYSRILRFLLFKLRFKLGPPWLPSLAGSTLPSSAVLLFLNLSDLSRPRSSLCPGPLDPGRLVPVLSLLLLSIIPDFPFTKDLTFHHLVNPRFLRSPSFLLPRFRPCPLLSNSLSSHLGLGVIPVHLSLSNPFETIPL